MGPAEAFFWTPSWNLGPLALGSHLALLLVRCLHSLDDEAGSLEDGELGQEEGLECRRNASTAL